MIQLLRHSPRGVRSGSYSPLRWSPSSSLHPVTGTSSNLTFTSSFSFSSNFTSSFSSSSSSNSNDSLATTPSRTRRNSAPRLRIVINPLLNVHASYPYPWPFQTKRLAASFSTEKLKTSSSKEEGGILRLLTDEQRQLLHEQRQLTQRAKRVANEMGLGLEMEIKGDDAETTDESSIMTGGILGGSGNGEDGDEVEQLLESTFAVVVAGEFNAGKSTIINALLGKQLLQTGALPTTDAITILTSHPSNTNNNNNNNNTNENDISTNNHNETNPNAITTTHKNALTIHRIPNHPLLLDLTLIDTPGTNAVVANHTARTLRLLPAADLILFVTGADRPFSQSERSLLRSIQEFRKNVVVLVNKMDLLEAAGGNHGEMEKRRVTEFVVDNAAELLGAAPVVLPLSARDALSAKWLHESEGGGGGGESKSWDSATWQRSQFGELEEFLRTALTAERRVKSKLLNPVGVAEGTVGKCITILDQRNKDLVADISTLNLLNGQMGAWTRDVEDDMKEYLSNVSDVLNGERSRCRRFLGDTTLSEKYHWILFQRTAELQDKWDKSKTIRAGQNATDSLRDQILNIVRQCSDALASSAGTQGQAVVEYLGQRPAVIGQNLIGSITAASRFETTRRNLGDSMTNSVESALVDYQPHQERDAIFRSIGNTIRASCALHASAVVTGGMAFGEVMDAFSGSLSAVVLATMGVALVPIQSTRLASKFEAEWDVRSEALGRDLDSLCSNEVQIVRKRIMDGVSPYTRYVRAEQERNRRLGDECGHLLSALQTLRSRITKL